MSDSATPWTVAHQAPPSMGFSKQEYWSGLPFPSPGDLPDSGIKPRSPALQADALPSETPGKPWYHYFKRILSNFLSGLGNLRKKLSFDGKGTITFDLTSYVSLFLTAAWYFSVWSMNLLNLNLLAMNVLVSSSFVFAKMLQLMLIIMKLISN